MYDKNYFQIFSKKFKIFSKNFKIFSKKFKNFEKNFRQKLDSVKGFENIASYRFEKLVFNFFNNKKRTIKIIFKYFLKISKYFQKNLKNFKKNFRQKLSSVKGFEYTVGHRIEKTSFYFFENKKSTVKNIFKENSKSSKI